MKSLLALILAALLAPAALATYSQDASAGATMDYMTEGVWPDYQLVGWYVHGTNSAQHDVPVYEPFNGRMDKISMESFAGLVGPYVLAQAKRQLTFTGTTNGSGVYTVTFGTAFSLRPNIQAQLINGTAKQTARVTAISATGFTIKVEQRNDIAGLVPTYSDVSGATVDVLVTET